MPVDKQCVCGGGRIQVRTQRARKRSEQPPRTWQQQASRPSPPSHNCPELSGSLRMTGPGKTLVKRGGTPENTTDFGKSLSF